MYSIGTWWMWTGFLIFILIMLGIDLYAFGGKKAHKVNTYESLAWSCVWISLALIFNLLFWWYLKTHINSDIAYQKGLEFFTGYVLEKSLSLDNIFVFLMIFNYFAVPAEYQRRVLLYGVLGAIILRAIMILFGVWLISKADWILYIFGLFLAFTGTRMIFIAEHEPDLTKNPILRFLRTHMRITDTFQGEKFSILKNGVRYMTPLFLVLVIIEISDVIFAIDSIPAIFGITLDPFIVFTSNIFAILGLRALYFLLQNLSQQFHLLKYGIAVILIFIGVKMLIVDWIHVPVLIPLASIATLIVGSILLSMRYPRTESNKK